MPLVAIDRHLTAADLARTLRAEVRDGLTGTPKALSPKWLYDSRGSALFEGITRLQEYYLTDAERAILTTWAGAIAAASGADTLLELGSGSSDKTRLLLDAVKGAGILRRYIPVDVSASALREAAARIADDYPGVDVHGVVADFERHIDRLPSGGRRMIALLGSTIGNFTPAPRAEFLARVRASMGPGDSLLLGTDLVKDRGRLVAAYDDASGVTAAFNRNVLYVMNRELGADFDPDAFAHVAAWDPDNEWIEMRLRSVRDQTVRIPPLELRVEFAAGEEMRTETSAKFRRERVEAELASAGFTPRGWWTDPAGDFALSLGERV
ncbi:MAG: L-histidine N(alpha)-methyltransferase [Streptosporangiaceae bacterium]